MDDYAGRVLADRYRLPLPAFDEYEFVESRAFDTYTGQEVLIRQVPLPEVVDAEMLDGHGGLDRGLDGGPHGGPHGVPGPAGARRSGRAGRSAATRRPADPVVRRAVEAAQAAAAIPDHPRLDQVFDVFAEDGSLWIVSELVAARPLAAFLAERRLNPYRAAEVASDVLMALRVLHAHGWVHRNITARTVLVCDDGRIVLTGLASGAAEEALCGYDPVPAADTPDLAPAVETPGPAPAGQPPVRPPVRPSNQPLGLGAAGQAPGIGPASGAAGPAADAEASRRAAIEARAGRLPGAGAGARGRHTPERQLPGDPAGIRAARAGAIAAYRAGTRAAARVQEAQESGRAMLPGARPPAEGADAGQDASSNAPSHAPSNASPGMPPGRIADPYGVRGASPWHGATPRSTDGEVPPGSAPGDALSRNSAGGDALPPNSTAAEALVPVDAPQDDRTPLPPAPRPGALPPGYRPGAGAHGIAPVADMPPSQGPNDRPGEGRWGDMPTGAPGAGRGPATALAAERARQARMTVVGPVTERWSPEQAVPVHDNWQLAAPVGPATDLWALGALLFRAVQGHAPYPEESTVELVELVVSEPPAFAEECGPLRPVVESLLRQDPTERPDEEELSGWLRSLVRSAPEPEAGADVVNAPPADPRRLPIKRRKGELVRRRRAGAPAASAHGRHKRARGESAKGSPRRLGRVLLLLILLVLVAAFAYAMLFMPKAGQGSGAQGTGRSGSVGESTEASPSSRASEASGGRSGEPGSGGATPKQSNGPAGQASSASASEDDVKVADGFTLRDDPEGFRIAVPKGWSRAPKNGRGQVVYGSGNFEVIVVPGRDTAARYGSDPMAYQRENEPELQPFRDSTWATSSGMRRVEVGQQVRAEGQFTWTDAQGRELFVRNLAILSGGRYHVVQVRGPEAELDEVTRIWEQASSTYRFGR